MTPVPKNKGAKNAKAQRQINPLAPYGFTGNRNRTAPARQRQPPSYRGDRHTDLNSVVDPNDPQLRDAQGRPYQFWKLKRKRDSPHKNPNFVPNQRKTRDRDDHNLPLGFTGPMASNNNSEGTGEGFNQDGTGAGPTNAAFDPYQATDGMSSYQDNEGPLGNQMAAPRSGYVPASGLPQPGTAMNSDQDDKRRFVTPADGYLADWASSFEQTNATPSSMQQTASQFHEAAGVGRSAKKRRVIPTMTAPKPYRSPYAPRNDSQSAEHYPNPFERYSKEERIEIGSYLSEGSDGFIVPRPDGRVEFVSREEHQAAEEATTNLALWGDLRKRTEKECRDHNAEVADMFAAALAAGEFDSPADKEGKD